VARLGIASLLLFTTLSTLAAPLTQGTPELVELPAGATALEGVPFLRVNSDESETQREGLTNQGPKKKRLLITIVDGQFFWASRENRPLRLTVSGSFSYLSGGPGSYVKFARFGDRIVYMEHATLMLSTITYWGELSVITGK
jgi:hypothetical protein